MSAPGEESFRRKRVNNGSNSLESLARQILEVDPGVLDCNITSDPEGAVLANLENPSSRGRIESYSRTGSGMGPAWGITIVNILRRLDKERSKLNYVMVSREKFNAVFFPAAKREQNLVIGVLLEKNADTARIYEAVMRLLT